MPSVLCVAEKPSIARAITEILSGGNSRQREGRSKYNKNFDFTYPQTNSHFTVTSVSGHMMEHDFPETHRKWHSCDPFELFDAPIETRVKPDAKAIETNLRQEAANADTLMIWTDCDREGENIGNEVKQVCRKANRNIRVVRARFSAIIPAQIHNAAQHPVELDIAQSDAVEARTILDLRLGAAFTRMQSLALQASINDLDGTLVSYGPCQFPTLGFVVSRYEQVKSFAPEQFWYIHLALTSNQPGEGEAVTEFNWRRNRIFDLEVAAALYEMVHENPEARVTSVKRKNTKKFKPYPLTTVELQKAASRILRLTPKKVLDIAESLYQKGFLSYPRTETDQFDDAFDFQSLIEKQRADPDWGAFATGLQNGAFAKPRKGKKNDKAHPPIHPTAHAGNLAGDDKRVYEFVTRRYLACCSKDAEGFETTVEVVSGGEEFSATGLVVLERNYLEVYPYDKWNGKYLPNFEEGAVFIPSECALKDGHTTAPSYLTEADLVTLMDKNGIGTDATIAQHIQTIIDREYVTERMEGRTKYLVPSTLGIGLIKGYDRIGFEKNLSKPQLRRETERMMVQVCESTRTKNQMLDQAIEQYREVFLRARNNFQRVIQSVSEFIQGQPGAPGNDGNGGLGGGGGGGGGGPGRGGGAGRGAGRGAPAGRGPRGGRGGGGPPGAGRGTRPPPKDNSGDDFDNDDAPPPPSRSRARVNNPPPPPPRANSAPNPNQAGGTPPNCRCDVPAAELTVVKEGPNKGKRFWTCPEKKCNFFEWVVGSSSNSSSGPTMPSRSNTTDAVVPAKRPLPSRANSNQTGDGPPKCECGLLAVVRFVQKEGPNRGRSFWRCSKPQDSDCKFFAWCEDDAGSTSNGAGAGGSQSQRGAGGGAGFGGSARTGSGAECFKCGEEGHWSSACPNPDGQNKRPRMETPSAASGRECYKCGKEGHFSNACPNPGGNSGRSGYSGSRGGGSSMPAGAKCFKCDEEGHYSNACPNGESRGGASSRGRGGSKRGGRGGAGRRSSTSSRGSRTGSTSRRGKKSSKFAAVD